METLARVAVFVKRGAIELAKAMCVRREMTGDPIEQYADTGPVRRVDKIAKFVRRPVTHGGGEQSDGLVSP